MQFIREQGSLLQVLLKRLVKSIREQGSLLQVLLKRLAKTIREQGSLLQQKARTAMIFFIFIVISA